MRDFDLIPYHYEEHKASDSFNLNLDARFAQQFANLQNDEVRRKERIAAYQAWSSSTNIKKRFEEHEKTLKAATERGLSLAEYLNGKQGEPFPDPLPDPLPARFKGQSESTIRALMRQEKEAGPKVWGIQNFAYQNPSTFTLKSK